MKGYPKNNVLLLAGVLILAVLCYLSVSGPIRFQRQRTEREVAVKQRLMKIRAAEEHYRSKTGVYTGDFGKLTAGGWLPDSLQFIPYSDGRRFSLTATTVIGKSGQQIPLMECGAGYADYLKGLDENSIANLIEEANLSGRYGGLKIGDITEPNNNAGNWE
ncbi:MAG: hypothetical protein I3J02_07690 [Prevotella sp.]|nr:hypothetical protein [Prevotella sp.]